MWNPLEYPWLLIAAAAASLVILYFYQMFKPDGFRKSVWLISVAILLAAFMIDYAFKTDREKIRYVIRNLVDAAEKENPKEMLRYISEDYTDSTHRTKRSLEALFRSRITESLIAKNVHRILEMDITGQNASIVLVVRTLFDEKGEIYEYKPLMLTKFKIDLAKQPDNNWLIERCELVELDRQPTTWSVIHNARYEY